MAFLFVFIFHFWGFVCASKATGVATGLVGQVDGAKKGLSETSWLEGTRFTKDLGVEKTLPHESNASCELFCPFIRHG